MSKQEFLFPFMTRKWNTRKSYCEQKFILTILSKDMNSELDPAFYKLCSGTEDVLGRCVAKEWAENTL